MRMLVGIFIVALMPLWVPLFVAYDVGGEFLDWLKARGGRQ